MSKIITPEIQVLLDKLPSGVQEKLMDHTIGFIDRICASYESKSLTETEAQVLIGDLLDDYAIEMLCGKLAIKGELVEIFSMLKVAITSIVGLVL